MITLEEGDELLPNGNILRAEEVCKVCLGESDGHNCVCSYKAEYETEIIKYEVCIHCGGKIYDKH